MGKRYIVVATDYFTKHNCPREILTDRGVVFVNQIVTNLIKIMGTYQRLTSAYHSKSNGLTEQIPIFVHSTSVYEQAPTLPIELDIITWPVEKIDEKQFKEIIHKKTEKVIGIFEDNRIQIRDMVLEYRSDLQNVHSDKFRDKWSGLFFIHRVLGNSSYILRTNNGEVLNREARVIIDNTGAYLVTESTVIEIDQLVNNEITTQCDDMLMIYTVDIFTALEEQDRVIDYDLDELL
ncbi:hypothetical protein Glove_167g15 [Diversispora epigaea]|uniref:Integrase catalytic domain-containing protein n=1 Tax=Diversispora epigaea TaxID=1348612 RepID=A0A397IZ36_9GLOM|nr:hypothetical protein Glove_167g15 [Diversispora epigaea]